MAAIRKQISLLGLMAGTLISGGVLWGQMQPERSIGTTVELRGVDIHVRYKWGCPFVYRETWQQVRYEKELDAGRYAENYSELTTRGDLETLRRIFPEHDIVAWVESQEEGWDRWFWTGRWHILGLGANASIVTIIAVVVAWVLSPSRKNGKVKRPNETVNG